MNNPIEYTIASGHCPRCGMKELHKDGPACLRGLMRVLTVLSKKIHSSREMRAIDAMRSAIAHLEFMTTLSVRGRANAGQQKRVAQAAQASQATQGVVQ